MKGKILPIKCPHCKKDLHTLEATVLVQIKKHLSDVKAQFKLLNYLVNEKQDVDKNRQMHGDNYMICPHCDKPITFFVSDKQRKEIIKLTKKGYSLRDIEHLTGTSYSTVGRILRQHKVDKSGPKT